MIELKPCPFCGGKAIFLEDDDGRVLPWLICSGCSCETDCYDTIEEAIAAWNRRASGWISVKDRMPEISLSQKDRVLVNVAPSKAHGSDVCGIDTDRTIDGKTFVRWGYRVTHWMPLPDAPEVPE